MKKITPLFKNEELLIQKEEYIKLLEKLNIFEALTNVEREEIITQYKNETNFKINVVDNYMNRIGKN